MSCILHLIWGPTCSGKTEVAVALAEQTGWPVIALDRVQCCPEMSTCSGRPLPAELRATRRIYLASRAVREGIIAADEAHALLVDLVDRRSAAGGVILEGGSISLINRMILDPYWANDWQWRSHRLLLGECADFLDRAYVALRRCCARAWDGRRCWKSWWRYGPILRSVQLSRMSTDTAIRSVSHANGTYRSANCCP